LVSYDLDYTKAKPVNREREQEFLERFEQIKVEIVKPVMEQIGKLLEKRGHSYTVIDKATIYDNNPSIKMEIYPKTPAKTPIQDHEFPTISFIAEPDLETVGVEVRDGMPGRPGLARGHTTHLDALTRQYVSNQIITVIKLNFSKRGYMKDR
jgi:hypothetical protein